MPGCNTNLLSPYYEPAPVLDTCLHKILFDTNHILETQNPPTNAGDADLIPGLGRSPGVENDNLLQYSCLENSMDRGAWWAIVDEVAELDMTEQLSN